MLREFSTTEGSSLSWGLLTWSDIGGVFGFGFFDTEGRGECIEVGGIGEFRFPVSELDIRDVGFYFALKPIFQGRGDFMEFGDANSVLRSFKRGFLRWCLVYP